MSHDMLSYQLEPEPRDVEAFAVLDLDRTLLNTDALVDAMFLALLNHGIGEEQVQIDLMFVNSKAGQSFSLMEYFIAEHGRPLYELVMQDVTDLAATDERFAHRLLIPGTIGLLDALDESDIPYMIMTFGETENQEFKLRLLSASLDKQRNELNALITSEPKKADWIMSTWMGEDGRFHVPSLAPAQTPLIADEVIVVDDKAHNVRSDGKSYGILVDNTDEPVPGTVSTLDIAVALRNGMRLQDLIQHEEEVTEIDNI
jgi:hypothetical protein